MAATPTIVIHGGAGALHSMFPVDVDGLLSSIQQAARAGYQCLVGNTSSAVDAVEAAVRCMEDNPLFNAGTGSVLTIEEDIEMDALIMEGKNLKAGGVACVKNVKNPVSLARLVMDKTEHVLLAGEGACKFATANGVPLIKSQELLAENRLKELQARPVFERSVHQHYKDRKLGLEDHDTVGAVALDAHGTVACATSTGGIRAKMAGRVGDVPLIGSGGYCDNAVGAVSTTGHGEAIAKVTLARQVVFNMEKGMSPHQALENALSYMEDRVGSRGGAVAVSSDGQIGYYFNTQGMTWASVQDGQMHYGIYPGQDLVVHVAY